MIGAKVKLVKRESWLIAKIVTKKSPSISNSVQQKERARSTPNSAAITSPLVYAACLKLSCPLLMGSLLEGTVPFFFSCKLYTYPVGLEPNSLSSMLLLLVEVVSFELRHIGISVYSFYLLRLGVFH